VIVPFPLGEEEIAHRREQLRRNLTHSRRENERPTSLKAKLNAAARNADTAAADTIPG
jgi:hypothetical protein